MAWNPAQYDKFRDERYAPFADLVALGQFRPRQHIVDLGCGTGELTARLLTLSPAADIVGIDSSAAMLERAANHTQPGLRFEQRRIEDYVSDAATPPDVLFSHAALQWIDDHPTLFARLAAPLPPGAQLLVQMPSNHDHVSHAIVRQVVSESPFRERLGGLLRRSPVLSIAHYAELLYSLGFAQPIVLEKVYGHTLPDAQAVLEWVRGTLLVPYLERLAPEHHSEFLTLIGQRFAEAMPQRPYYYAFRRILLAATRTTA